MVKEKYSPERGDIVWLNYIPQSGQEQKEKRPAVVISPKEYNEKVGLGLFCPITSKIKNYPFEVEIANEIINGVILSDQIKSLDWRTRDIEFITRIPPEQIDDIITKMSALL
jgi:mRNA interferase MazF